MRVSSSLFCIFKLSSFPRASMFSMLAFLNFLTIQEVLMTIYDLNEKF